MNKAIRILFAGCLAVGMIWAADVTGKWSADFQAPNGNTFHAVFNLKANGEKLTGTVSGPRGGETEISDGKVDGKNVSFKVVREYNGNQVTMTYEGQVDGDVLHLTVKREGGEGGGPGGRGGARQFDAKRSS